MSEIRFCTVTNEKLAIDNKQISHIMSDANTLILSQQRIVRLNHNHLLNILKTNMLGIISQILHYKKYHFII